MSVRKIYQVGVEGYKKIREHEQVREKIISTGELLTLISKIKAKHIFIYSDKKWPYPEQGDTQGTCMMLDMNFNVEKRPGIVIHIPNETLEDLKKK